MKDCHLTDKALRLYMMGVSMDDVEEMTGIQLQRAGTVTDEMKKRHNCRRSTGKARLCRKWEEARNALLASGHDLSKIILVEEK